MSDRDQEEAREAGLLSSAMMRRIMRPFSPRRTPQEEIQPTQTTPASSTVNPSPGSGVEESKAMETEPLSSSLPSMRTPAAMRRSYQSDPPLVPSQVPGIQPHAKPSSEQQQQAPPQSSGTSWSGVHFDTTAPISQGAPSQGSVRHVPITPYRFSPGSTAAAGPTRVGDKGDLPRLAAPPNKFAVSTERGSVYAPELRTVPRTYEQITAEVSFIPRHLRLEIQKNDTKAFELWKKKCEQGLMKPKLSFLEPATDKATMTEQTGSLYSKLRRVKQDLESLDLLAGFDVYSPLWSDTERPVSTGMNLLSDDLFSRYSREDILSLQMWYNAMASDEQADAQKHIKVYLEHSCEATLLEHVLNGLDAHDKAMHGGLIMMKLIIDQTLVNDYDYRQLLIDTIFTKKVTDYEGSDVSALVKELNPLLKKLDSFLHNQWERDYVIKLHKVFMTSPCALFNQRMQESIDLIEGSQRGVRGAFAQAARCSVTIDTFANLEGMLDITSDAVAQYRALVRRGEWVSKSKKPSAYAAVKIDGKFKDPCWNCGSFTHHLNDCSAPKDRKKIAANKKRHYENRKKGQSKAKKEKGKKQETEPTTTVTSYVARDESLQKVAPGKGESHRQIMNGKMAFWCGRGDTYCYWNHTHLSKDHNAWLASTQPTAAAQNTSAPSVAPSSVSTSTAGTVPATINVASVPSPSVLTQAFSAWRTAGSS